MVETNHNYNRNNDDHHQQQHHNQQYQSTTQRALLPPVTATAAATTQHQTRLPASDLVTKETIVQNQHRQQTLSNRLLDSGSKLLVKRFPKLADFDQVALVLAGFLCVCTFLIALIAIVCTCCCSPKRGLKPALTRLDGSQASQCSPTNLSSSLANRTNKHSQTKSNSSSSSGSNCLIRFLCCCLTGSRQSPSVTPIHSLIMHEDDNSTSSSGDGSSPSSGLNGKSMLLASTQLNQSKALYDGASGVNGRNRRHLLNKSNTLNQRKSLARLGPLNLEASMRLHRQAHAIDKGAASGGYFLGMNTGLLNNNSNSIINNHHHHNGRTIGRRKTRWASEMDLDQTKADLVGGCGGASYHREGTLVRKFTIGGGGGGGWISDSCDSDKSCSPGANRNNRYNISDAHKAYLAGKQIQASMFVTTQSGSSELAAATLMQANSHFGAGNGAGQRTSGNGRRLGLLKTIDSASNVVDVHQRSLNQPDYFGNCSSSDRSTDDSRAPLDRMSPLQQRDILPVSRGGGGGGGGGAGFHINRSISMSSKFPTVGRAVAAAATSSFGQTMSQHNNEQQQGAHKSANNNQLNYQQAKQQQQHHHYNQQQSSSNHNQRIYEMSSGDLLPISAEEEWPEPYVEPLTASSNELFAVQSTSDNNNNHNNNSSQHVYSMNNEQTSLARHSHNHDPFHTLDNHQSQDRQFDVDYIQQAQVMSNHLLTNRSYDEAYLANWRTIGRNPSKSTADHNNRPTIGGGGTNWLRWTPADDNA